MLSFTIYRPREQDPQKPMCTYEQYLVAFHEHLLLPVCESSNLGCLSYKCGPSLKCQQCKVPVTLPYIQKESESDAKTSPKLSMKCPECELGDYDINDCLGQVRGSFLW